MYFFCVCQIQVGVEFEASTRTQETTTSFGYKMELPEANMVFRGKLQQFNVMLTGDDYSHCRRFITDEFFSQIIKVRNLQ